MLGKLKSALRGRQRLQPLFEALHAFALTGMNYGGGSTVGDSGEVRALEYVRRRLHDVERPLIVCDVGANEGQYTEQVLRVFGHDAKVLAFEPARRAFEVLRRRLGRIPQVAVRNFGLSDANTVLPLYEVEDQPGLSSIHDRRLDHVALVMKLGERVQVRTLEDVCTEEGITRINLLKLDVEGHELKVLLGAKRLLDAGVVDFIQFEFGGCNIDSRTFFQDFFYLLNAEYVISRILRDGLRPLTSYVETHEVFLTTNYLAERRRIL